MEFVKGDVVSRRKWNILVYFGINVLLERRDYGYLL
jgi:hypothetical protein